MRKTHESRGYKLLQLAGLVVIFHITMVGSAALHGSAASECNMILGCVTEEECEFVEGLSCSFSGCMGEYECMASLACSTDLAYACNGVSVE